MLMQVTKMKAAQSGNKKQKRTAKSSDTEDSTMTAAGFAKTQNICITCHEPMDPEEGIDPR